MGENLLTAEAIGSAARYDPQLRIPVRPRQRRGTITVQTPDGIEIHGTPKRQTLKGTSATEVVGPMLSLLDGTRTHEQLSEETGVSAEHVFKVIALLWASGLVEESAPAGETPETPEQVADFLSRAGDSTGANLAWEWAARRMAAEQVQVIGPLATASVLAAELDQPLRTLVGPIGLDAGTTLLVAVETPADPIPEAVDQAWDQGIPVLRVRISAERIECGPLALPGMGPCLGCLDRTGESTTAPAPSDIALGCAMAAREVFALTSRAITTGLPIRWRSIDPRTLASSEQACASRVGCPRCSSAAPSSVDPAPAPATAVFEASVGMPVRRYLDVKAHQMHYKASNLALQQTFRVWPTAPRHQLPPAPLGWLDQAPHARRADADSVSLLLLLAAGIQGLSDGRVFRWTPNGGNIGSISAYLINRSLPGLPRGVHAYIADEHCLATLNPEVPDGDRGQDPATIVLTGDFFKVAAKYNAFALRIVLLDSGCAQATVHAACDQTGIRAQLPTEWDDHHLARALGIDLESEPITAVINLQEATS